MSYSKIVLGLGSNHSLGDLSSPEILKRACVLLEEKIVHIKKSSLYRTTAMYYEDQEDFYNMVVAGFYSGSPRELLDFIHEVERSLGRDRTKEFRNGPRTLDVDIELFDNEKINDSDLIIPHPRMEERAFVLIPMLEIFSENAELDIKGQYYKECLEKLPPQGIWKL
ncbi:MAG: 2-amino-4-hydroxy-6-hydroxymethyldihydropteridine diphosphokinase [Candidatus Treponema excrementipullorum]|nr:2-amino-4-hydroxy-6-hydroxymethyldihydropteridine diphosphokinase [Spirochaetia bacterium]MCI7589085.1 2-amino-4-hydroxy-6-hydroxymethyldihydropteridine diphosphokinase [Spirochaetia bacterium]MDY2755809.1 2-amino-4-hydroxy-6-hydroxymethyldihydropteridine diphosphokinase [Candidatus Treponema excrementipullorum]MDY4464766.1 2-amino-4-hydroxy-6-hydroxymethyldihydropteridine diphosphokinase [Candidatus Treponema excrementipullorum]